jgi:hypothetical protein
MFKGPEKLQLGKTVPPWPNVEGFLQSQRSRAFELDLAASIFQAIPQTLGEYFWEL